MTFWDYIILGYLFYNIFYCGYVFKESEDEKWYLTVVVCLITLLFGMLMDIIFVLKWIDGYTTRIGEWIKCIKTHFRIKNGYYNELEAKDDYLRYLAHMYNQACKSRRPLSVMFRRQARKIFVLHNFDYEAFIKGEEEIAKIRKEHMEKYWNKTNGYECDKDQV